MYDQEVGSIVTSVAKTVALCSSSGGIQ